MINCYHISILVFLFDVVMLTYFLWHQDRHYVTVKSRVLYPEFRGRMVRFGSSH